MTRPVPRGEPHVQARNTWWVDWDGEIVMRCPCGVIGSLSGHGISSEGLVDPSVECPGRLHGSKTHCSYHHHVVLEDWPSGKTQLASFG